MEARYLQIVDDIRRRISTGALRPGARVPSTRQITREWGVAMATATRVLATLRDEGLVRSAPGAGTVVAERRAAPTPAHTERPRRRGRTPEITLSTQRIVAAAVAIADAEGLAALSMRRVAVDLGVATMALYRHVPSKTELVHRMVDAVFGQQQLPDPTPRGWRPRLELVTRSWWRTVRQHPWVAGTGYLTRPTLVPTGVAHAELAMRTIAGLGLDPGSSARTCAALAGYLQGMTSYLESADADPHPGADPDPDGLFEYGLGLILDGLAGRHASPPPRD